MAKKITQAQKIRDYFTKHPGKTVSEVAKEMGLKYQTVYMTKRTDGKKLSDLAYQIGKGRTRAQDWKTVHISTSDNSVEKAIQDEVDKYHAKLKNVAPYMPMQIGLTQHKNSVEKAIQDEVDKYHAKLKNVAPYVPMQIDLTQHKDGSITEKITMIEPEADPVNHPAHYKIGGIETIDFIEAKRLNYNMGNAVKYITRADHKGNRKQDLEKALWYIQRELDHSI
jgi:flavin-binding protein dodecin